MILIAKKLVIAWDKVEAEFVETKTLKDKNLLIAIMHQPWELCDIVFIKWSEANEITLHAKNPLREVAAKHLFSA